MTQIRILSTSLLFVCGALLSCSKPPAPKEAEPCDRQVVSAAVISTQLINLTETGEPRPVQLRIYQLKNDVGFRNASFEQIWKEDQDKLGADMLDRQEFPVYPNTRKQVDFERNPEAQYVVAAALFRDPKGKQWFSTFELPPPPGQEACGAKCPDGQCEEPPELNPKLYIRLDGGRVSDGSDWADYFPEKEVAKSESRETL
ncbi:MAG TPA: type VI secretion system lipoprotein TssJ [Polyangiaceae bacterium]|nr:type VI secretion system lipoprotein TssJ [Polyangiaceae bacterium]